MAQSQKELDILQNKHHRRKSTTKMVVTKDQMMEMDPEEVLDWEVESLEVGLKELNVTVGAK